LNSELLLQSVVCLALMVTQLCMSVLLRDQNYESPLPKMVTELSKYPSCWSFCLHNCFLWL